VLFFGAMPFGAGTALIPSLAPNRMRGQLMAVYLLLANLVGGGVGPWLVAVFTDYVAGDPLLIRYSLAVVGSILFALGAAAMAVGIRSFGRNRLVMSEAAAAA
jgi:MFS family permease